MDQYEETEQLAVDEKKKRLHYERIRIQENRTEIKTEFTKLESAETLVDEKVFNDTKAQQNEKHRIDNLIDDLDKEIEALRNQLKQKERNKEMLVLEKGVYEKQIAQARSKYMIPINKN